MKNWHQNVLSIKMIRPSSFTLVHNKSLFLNISTSSYKFFFPLPTNFDYWQISWVKTRGVVTFYSELFLNLLGKFYLIKCKPQISLIVMPLLCEVELFYSILTNNTLIKANVFSVFCKSLVKILLLKFLFPPPFNMSKI